MIGKLFKKTTYVTLSKENSVITGQPNVPAGDVYKVRTMSETAISKRSC